MGFFDENSSVSNTQNLSQPQTLQDVGGMAIIGGSAPITLTDGGAFKESVKFGSGVLKAANAQFSGLVKTQNKGLSDLLGFARDANAQAFKFADSAGGANNAALFGVLKLMAAAGAVFAVAMILRK
jgi:hypothetical protein